MNVRVKICGITRLDDALQAVAAGADALGFVFYEPSPRYITPEIAASIIKKLPPFVTTTALFVNADDGLVQTVIDTCHIDLLQFHGDESVVYCEQFVRPYIKALRMKPGVDVKQVAEDYASARGLLLDAYKAGVPGGTGESFNWDMIPDSMRSSIILAGGLDADNIHEAIKHVQPYAVDVSGGVEANKGVKSPTKIQRFFEEVARANNE
jgi:phosphoribosylanthranilate isomerase